MDYQLLELLHRNGLRNTHARQTVFQVLKKQAAVTVRELAAKTAAQLDTASMYRTLNLFRKLGVVQDVVIAGRRKVELTDSFSPHHHHIACSSCGITVALHNQGLEDHIELLAQANGFSHQSHSFEITGVCSSCAAKL